MEQIIQTCQTAGAIASMIVTIATCLSLLVKPIREKVFAGVKVSEAEKEGIKCLLRDAILNVYFNGRETKTIDELSFESLMLKYQAYKALGGNSFIDKIYGEIVDTWEVVHAQTGV